MLMRVGFQLPQRRFIAGLGIVAGDAIAAAISIRRGRCVSNGMGVLPASCRFHVRWTGGHVENLFAGLRLGAAVGLAIGRRLRGRLISLRLLCT
jgi:hypothetical protein